MSDAQPISGTYIKAESWEKQAVWKLSNGCKIIEEYNHAYGPMVTSIEDKKGRWHCSAGLRSLPERFKWVLAWSKPAATSTILVPDIIKIYPKQKRDIGTTTA